MPASAAKFRRIDLRSAFRPLSWQALSSILRSSWGGEWTQSLRLSRSGWPLYVAAGLVAGLAFVIFGVTAVQSAPVTVGARILLLPGATALWPLVLSRWLKSRSRR